LKTTGSWEPEFYLNLTGSDALPHFTTYGGSNGAGNQTYRPGRSKTMKCSELLSATLLEESEMNVIQCESAEAAVYVLDQSGRGLSIIFTDVELAGIMDGIELAPHRPTEVSPICI